MASPTKKIEDGSDKKCQNSCGLSLGKSEIFDQNVIEQQKIRAAKNHIQPQIFDDPQEQKKYNHMTDDVMFKIFDDEAEQKIFRKAFEGLDSHYTEILKDKEKHMFYCPTSFNFDSRIGTNETSVPAELEKIQATLERRKIQIFLVIPIPRL